MIEVNGDNITNLYTYNLLSEIFPDYCFSKTKNLKCTVSVTQDLFKVNSTVCIDGNLYMAQEYFSSHLNNRLAMTTSIGKAIFQFAKKMARPIPQYGVLTGVRPFKIAVDLLSRFEYDEVMRRMNSVYCVSENKTELLMSAAMYDQKVRISHAKNDISVYISIPFCPTRCNYCSFISSSAPSKLNLLDLYLEQLKKEISLVSELISKNSLNVKSIYVGGGTPTVLSSFQLKSLIELINSCFDKNHLVEFTVEAGRPDTINADKLDVMKLGGVTRTCVNCQTTNDSVLQAIGRAHTADDFFKAFELTAQYCFDTINTDIIAGLDTDTFESFANTVNDVISLSPQSITVHTLCVKKSSDIRLREEISLTKNIDGYINYSKDICILSGYLPYYLYKQKYSLGNHENVGYCLNGHESHYNIAMMNEIENIIGIGAGATSKILNNKPEQKTQHFYNFKYPTEYIGGFEKTEKNIIEMQNYLAQ